MSRAVVAALSLLAASTRAQRAGKLTPEVHPSLPSQQCTTSGGCRNVSSAIVLDSSFRWLHSVNGTTTCNANGGWDPSLCADPSACAQNCALEGVDYESFGVRTMGNAVTLSLFVQKNNATTVASPRIYLLANDTSYDSFKLVNQEFSFDVDTSKVPCGINGALYFSEMDASGSANNLNTAGAQYGTGYCDAQCPTVPFIDGEANLNNTYGACCNEMDIWEANSAATAFTPHACNITGLYKCTGTECGAGSERYDGVCDEDGCDFNAYRMGAHKFYGMGKKVDTSSKFTVITQFLTHNNQTSGRLSQIRRLYVQNGTVIHNAAVNIPGLKKYTGISDQYCIDQKIQLGGTDAFEAQGGMKGMGGALGRGMVLAMSIWEDSGSGMLWLDGTYPVGANSSAPGVARGTCGPESGDMSMLIEKYPDAAITFSNIKVGDIGSTFGASEGMEMRRRW